MPSADYGHFPLAQQRPFPPRTTEEGKSHCTSTGCLLLMTAISTLRNRRKSHCTSTAHYLLTTAISPSRNSW
ncbi:hypothetical protein FB451DRAFT_1396540 [Mycena latifolia]|nr:hypothetical protein FB451DRAFT_1396540 [Mycena latifolia]